MPLTKPEIDTMLADFVKAVIESDKAFRRNRIKTCNRWVTRSYEIYRTLKADGLDAIMDLLALMKHPDPSVRCAAASYGLRFTPRESEPVLEELKTLAPDIVGVKSGMALFVWRSGMLEPD